MLLENVNQNIETGVINMTVAHYSGSVNRVVIGWFH